MPAKKRRRVRSLGSPDCATEKKLTLCVGDRVERTIKLPAKQKQRLIDEGFWRGVVTAIHMGEDNQRRKKMAARVRFDGYEASDRPLPYLFEELKKVR